MIEQYNIDEILENDKLSDMMREYLSTKQKYKDCLLLYRVGDFYETYFNDAITMSNILNMTLTRKSCGIDEPAPMCGFPKRSLNRNLNLLVKDEYKVAIGEQLEDPKLAIGRLVNRDIIQIITPGTILDENLEFDSNNYLASVISNGIEISYSYVDINSGDIYISKFPIKYLSEELSKTQPKELLLKSNLINNIKNVALNYHIYLNDKFEEIDNSILFQYFNRNYINELNLDSIMIQNLIQLLSYIFYTQRKVSGNIDNIYIYDIDKTMNMDAFTRDSLELTKNIANKDKRNTLFSVLDKTNTAMGSRKLREMIEQPLIEVDKIERRQNIIQNFTEDVLLMDNISSIFKQVYDIERLCGRIAFENISPKELINLKKSIEELPYLKHLVEQSNAKFVKDFIKELDDLKDIFHLLDNAILDEPNINITEGNIIKSSYNTTLENYRELINNAGSKIKELETKLKEKLKLNLLKIGYNEADGYYIELTKKMMESIQIPNNFIKIKDLSKSSRFTFNELKELEMNLLEASNKSNSLEYSLFVEVRNKLSENIHRLKEVSKLLAELDCYISLGKVAILNNYIKPTINSSCLNIKNGRHPVVEISNNEPFIGNDIFMNEDHLIHIITGANMSGKSTYMRQTALIILMAQMGSFVPCDSAEIPIFDRIFTRIGASDNLANGQSTFMVEMSEIAQILNTATSKSFLLLDEVGRGTSTYDGISIAASIIEYIQEELKCHTLFATHYIELTEIATRYKNIHNYKFDIKEEDDNITFLRKVIPGISYKSYGVYVAKEAGVPLKVVNRANEILFGLESKQNIQINENDKINSTIKYIEKDSQFEKDILSFDLMNMTPLDVFQYVWKIQEKLKNDL